MKKFKFYFFILPFLLFTSCSWSEYFSINNLSENPVYISYTITKPKDHNFGIFEHSPIFYETTKGNIDWNKKIEIQDSDSSKEVVSIILPPKSIMIFGRLNNDNYKSYDQYFINRREFNLDFIEIEVNLEILHVSKNTFDQNFTKEKGIIKYEIR